MEIHGFAPETYPRKFWVSVSTDTFSDSFEGVIEWDDTADSIVGCVRDKLRNLGGILVRFGSKDSITISDIAHEGSHIAMNIFDYICARVDLADQGTFSYLVGCVSDCINQVMTGKIKGWNGVGKV
jgi:hypothetical protein